MLSKNSIVLVFSIGLAGPLWPAEKEKETVQPRELQALLKAKAESIRTFRADIKLTELPGSDRQRYATVLRKRIEWDQQNRNGPQNKMQEQMIEALEKPLSPRVSYVRYFAKQPGLIRIEDLGSDESGRAFAGRGSVTEIYSGEKWHRFSARSESGKDGRFNHMVISGNSPHETRQIEVARGAAVFVTPFIGNTKPVSHAAQQLRQVYWDEVFRLYPANEATVIWLSLQGYAEKLPVLQLQGAKLVDGPGRFRLQLWLNKEKSFHLVRIECQHEEMDKSTGTAYFVPDMVAEWDKLKQFSNGAYFAERCLLRYNWRQSIPTANLAPSQWPGQSFEIGVLQVEFANVRINDELSDKLFQIDTPPSTNVVDEVAGVHYIVGSSGEELHRSALKLSKDRTDRNGRFWWRYLLAAVVIALVAAMVFWFLRQRRVPVRR